MGYITVGSLDDYYKKALEATKTQYEQGKTNINAMSDEQKKAVTEAYDKQISDTESAYLDKNRENAVQKIINEREVSENMANLGSTNSGLNRTQQTAVQLSYANNKAYLDRQKQSAFDSFAKALASELSGIETSRISALTDLENSYSQTAMENATKQRQADLDYNESLQKAEYDYNLNAAKAEYDYLIKQDKNNQEKENNFYRFNRIETDEYGNQKAIYDYNGKEKSVTIGMNPYTRANNLKTESVKDYGTFDNGYQPKGIKITVGGKTYDYGKLYWTNDYSSATGVQQKIWYTKDNNGKVKYWLWIGDDNAYQEMIYDSKTNEYKATSNVIYI